jgi:hypothetical protein
MQKTKVMFGRRELAKLNFCVEEDKQDCSVEIKQHLFEILI